MGCKMIFNKLTITNLGNFSGTHVLRLRSSDTKAIKPIVLFGGLNGAGKTTIFDAIKLCLYGPEMFGAIGVAKYQEYLKQKIHSSKITVVQPNNASIAVEFEYAHLGTVNTYQVERMWEISGQKVLETLSIEKNGLPLDDIEKDCWQDFIKEIIPLGLSQLFFFDGEKIQSNLHGGERVLRCKFICSTVDSNTNCRSFIRAKTDHSFLRFGIFRLGRQVFSQFLGLY